MIADLMCCEWGLGVGEEAITLDRSLNLILLTSQTLQSPIHIILLLSPDQETKQVWQKLL